MRRAAVLALLVLLGLPAGAGACGRPAGWAPDVRAARAWAAGRDHGFVAFSVRAGRRAWHHLPDARARSASVVKALLLVAELRRLRDRDLPAAIREKLAVMVRRSGNRAASAVRDRVTNPVLDALARRGRMRAFRAGADWGDSVLTARDAARLVHRIDALMPRRHRAFGMGLLRSVVAPQRWGVGEVVPRGWTLALKGGWGDDPGTVNHQAALLTRGCERVAVAVLTTRQPSHAYGRATLRGVAARLLRGLAGSPPG